MSDSLVVMKSKVAVFNEQWPVGSLVVVIKDLGERFKTKIRFPALSWGEHIAVVWVEDISRAYALDRVIPCERAK